jgi:mannose-6-phosphate isomerase-like protein (cupin superfamily)
MEILDAGRFDCPPGRPNHYRERLRVAALSAGTYSIPAGGVDDQRPHRQDEIYVVQSGAGSFTAGDRTVPVEPGSTIYVPAGEPHRFHDVTADLAVLVVFAPPYSGPG